MSKDNSRALGDLTSPDIPQRLSKSSVLCLPLGAIEQHGPHLPLNTDLIIAENIARVMTERLGDEFDLWRLPAHSVRAVARTCLGAGHAVAQRAILRGFVARS